MKKKKFRYILPILKVVPADFVHFVAVSPSEHNNGTTGLTDNNGNDDNRPGGETGDDPWAGVRGQSNLWDDMW